MTRMCVAGASVQLGLLPRWLAPAFLAALSISLHAGTLRGGFVWDDQPAVLHNHDVWINSPWTDMWRHDFWGQEMADAESHKSFRPLTTLTFRLNNVVQKWSSRRITDRSRNGPAGIDGWGDAIGRPIDAVGFHRVNVAVHAATCASTVFLFRQIFAGEELPALVSSLLFTVHPVHVEAVAPIVGRADLLCGFFAVLALSLIVRDRSSTANDRSVLHDRRNRRDSSLSPVGWDKKRDRKAQTVGKNKTKRKKKRERRAIARSKTMARTGAAVKAGDGCTAVSVMRQTSLGTELMTITCQDKFNGKDEEDGGDLDDRKDGTVARSPRWPTRGPTAPRAGNSEAFSTVTAAVAVEKSGNCGGGGDGGGDAGGGTVILETPAADPQQTTANLISASSRLTSADLPTEESVVELSPTSSRLHRATGGERVHPSSRRSTKRNPAPSTTVTRKWGLCSGRDNNVVVLGSGPGVVRFAAALGLAAAATLCKEVGVTVYLLIAGAELVRFLERAVFGVSKAGAVASGVGSAAGLRQALRDHWCRFGLAPAARFIASLYYAAVLVMVHLDLREGQAVRQWGVLENDISILPSPLHRALSYAFTHAFYVFKLVWPERLCYDWGFRCIPHVTSLSDPRNLAPLALYMGISSGTAIAVTRGDTALMWGLALLVVPFLPASNVFFPIGAVVAERLLYLPSLGICVLTGCTLRHTDPSAKHVGELEDAVNNKVPSFFDAGLDENSVHGLPSPSLNSYFSGVNPVQGKSMRKQCLASVCLPPAAANTMATKTKTTKTTMTTMTKTTTKSARPPTAAGTLQRRIKVVSNLVPLMSSPLLPPAPPSSTTTPHSNTKGKSQQTVKQLSTGPGTGTGTGTGTETETATGRREPSTVNLNLHHHPSSSPRSKRPADVNRNGRLEEKKVRPSSSSASSALPSSPASSSSASSSSASASASSSGNYETETAFAGAISAIATAAAVVVTWVGGSWSPRSSPTMFLTTRRTPHKKSSTRIGGRGGVVTVVLVLILASWTVRFGARTLERCADWNSDRRLFESALAVCPDGIKTLSNLGAEMLNVEEAARAEGLLRRAVELHPEFPSALFNLGVALILRGDHQGSVAALEKSIQLEGRNEKAFVYLGQEYLVLATERALEVSVATATATATTTTEALDSESSRGRNASIPPYFDDASSAKTSSPESLLSKAEFYTDQALAFRSRLPLAQLIKGDILVLKGQFQTAAEYFRAGIDLSLAHLTPGLSNTGSGSDSGFGSIDGGVVVEGGKGVGSGVDVLDLADTYNRLGLALREAGTDPGAALEAFLEGLSVAPEDFALLVNAGTAHQTAGDMAGASALYHRALKLNPDSPELVSNLGWLEEQSGGGSHDSLERAAVLYERALRSLGDVASPARRQVEINLANVQRRLIATFG